MISLLGLTTFAYTLPVEKLLEYRVVIDFDGFLPVLGGNEAKVKAEIKMQVKGLTVDPENRPRAESDLTDLSVFWDGEKLPFTVDSVRRFFPKNTITLNAQGRVLQTDAPDIQLPVRLPGLDVKRFPEITYLLVEFPESGLEVGKPFFYEKPFGDSQVQYEVTPKSIDNETIQLSIKLEQAFTTLEDAGRNLVTEESQATYRVKTTVTGQGEATYDRKAGVLIKSKVIGDSSSEVEPLKGGEKSSRKLRTTLQVQRLPE